MLKTVANRASALKDFMVTTGQVVLTVFELQKALVKLYNKLGNSLSIHKTHVTCALQKFSFQIHILSQLHSVFGCWLYHLRIFCSQDQIRTCFCKFELAPLDCS